MSKNFEKEGYRKILENVSKKKSISKTPLKDLNKQLTIMQNQKRIINPRKSSHSPEFYRNSTWKYRQCAYCNPEAYSKKKSVSKSTSK